MVWNSKVCPKVVVHTIETLHVFFTESPTSFSQGACFLLLCCFTQMLYLSLVPTARFRSPKDYNDNEASKNLFLHVFSTTSSLKHPICTCSGNKINLVNHHLESLSSKFQGIHHIPIVIGPIKVLNIKKKHTPRSRLSSKSDSALFLPPIFFLEKTDHKKTNWNETAAGDDPFQHRPVCWLKKNT